MDEKLGTPLCGVDTTLRSRNSNVRRPQLVTAKQSHVVEQSEKKFSLEYVGVDSTTERAEVRQLQQIAQASSLELYEISDHPSYMSWYQTPFQALNTILDKVMQVDGCRNLSKNDFIYVLYCTNFKKNSQSKEYYSITSKMRANIYYNDEDCHQLAGIAFKILSYLGQHQYKMTDAALRALVEELKLCRRKTAESALITICFVINNGQVFQTPNMLSVLDKALTYLSKVKGSPITWLKTYIVAITAKAKLGGKLTADELLVMQQCIGEVGDSEFSVPSIVPKVKLQKITNVNSIMGYFTRAYTELEKFKKHLHSKGAKLSQTDLEYAVHRWDDMREDKIRARILTILYLALLRKHTLPLPQSVYKMLEVGMSHPNRKINNFSVLVLTVLILSKTKKIVSTFQPLAQQLDDSMMFYRLNALKALNHVCSSVENPVPDKLKWVGILKKLKTKSSEVKNLCDFALYQLENNISILEEKLQNENVRAQALSLLLTTVKQKLLVTLRVQEILCDIVIDQKGSNQRQNVDTALQVLALLAEQDQVLNSKRLQQVFDAHINSRTKPISANSNRINACLLLLGYHIKQITEAEIEAVITDKRLQYLQQFLHRDELIENTTFALREIIEHPRGVAFSPILQGIFDSLAMMLKNNIDQIDHKNVLLILLGAAKQNFELPPSVVNTFSLILSESQNEKIMMKALEFFHYYSARKPIEYSDEMLSKCVLLLKHQNNQIATNSSYILAKYLEHSADKFPRGLIVDLAECLQEPSTEFFGSELLLIISENNRAIPDSVIDLVSRCLLHSDDEMRMNAVNTLKNLSDTMRYDKKIFVRLQRAIFERKEYILVSIVATMKTTLERNQNAAQELTEKCLRQCVAIACDGVYDSSLEFNALSILAIASKNKIDLKLSMLDTLANNMQHADNEYRKLMLQTVYGQLECNRNCQRVSEVVTRIVHQAAQLAYDETLIYEVVAVVHLGIKSGNVPPDQFLDMMADVLFSYDDEKLCGYVHALLNDASPHFKSDKVSLALRNEQLCEQLTSNKTVKSKLAAVNELKKLAETEGLLTKSAILVLEKIIDENNFYRLALTKPYLQTLITISRAGVLLSVQFIKKATALVEADFKTSSRSRSSRSDKLKKINDLLMNIIALNAFGNVEYAKLVYNLLIDVVLSSDDCTLVHLRVINFAINNQLPITTKQERNLVAWCFKKMHVGDDQVKLEIIKILVRLSSRIKLQNTSDLVKLILVEDNSAIVEKLVECLIQFIEEKDRDLPDEVLKSLEDNILSGDLAVSKPMLRLLQLVIQRSQGEEYQACRKIVAVKNAESQLCESIEIQDDARIEEKLDIIKELPIIVDKATLVGLTSFANSNKPSVSCRVLNFYQSIQSSIVLFDPIITCLLGCLDRSEYDVLVISILDYHFRQVREVSAAVLGSLYERMIVERNVARQNVYRSWFDNMRNNDVELPLQYHAIIDTLTLISEHRRMPSSQLTRLINSLRKCHVFIPSAFEYVMNACLKSSSVTSGAVSLMQDQARLVPRKYSEFFANTILQFFKHFQDDLDDQQAVGVLELFSKVLDDEGSNLNLLDFVFTLDLSNSMCVDLIKTVYQKTSTPIATFLVKKIIDEFFRALDENEQLSLLVLLEVVILNKIDVLSLSAIKHMRRLLSAIDQAYPVLFSNPSDFLQDMAQDALFNLKYLRDRVLCAHPRSLRIGMKPTEQVAVKIIGVIHSISIQHKSMIIDHQKTEDLIYRCLRQFARIDNDVCFRLEQHLWHLDERQRVSVLMTILVRDIAPDIIFQCHDNESMMRQFLLNELRNNLFDQSGMNLDEEQLSELTEQVTIFEKLWGALEESTISYRLIEAIIQRQYADNLKINHVQLMLKILTAKRIIDEPIVFVKQCGTRIINYWCRTILQKHMGNTDDNYIDSIIESFEKIGFDIDSLLLFFYQIDRETSLGSILDFLKFIQQNEMELFFFTNVITKNKPYHENGELLGFWMGELNNHYIKCCVDSLKEFAKGSEAEISHYHMICDLMHFHLLQLIAGSWSIDYAIKLMNGLLNALSNGRVVDLELVLFTIEKANLYELPTDLVDISTLVSKPQQTLSTIHNAIVEQQFDLEITEYNLNQLLSKANEENKNKRLCATVENAELFELITDAKIRLNDNPSPDFDRSISQWTIEDIKRWSVIRRNNADITENLAEVMAVLSRACELSFDYQPRNAQLLALFTLVLKPGNHGRLVQMLTGEGKSTLIAMYAVFMVLCGETVDIVTSSPMLARRDVEGYTKFYDSFKIKAAHNEDHRYTTGLKACYKPDIDIVYGTASNFQFDFLREEYSFLGTRGERPCGVVIVDEVDSLLIDEGSRISMLASSKPFFHFLNPILVAIWVQLQQIDTNCFSTDDSMFAKGDSDSADYSTDELDQDKVLYVTNELDKYFRKVVDIKINEGGENSNGEDGGKDNEAGKERSGKFQIPVHLQEFVSHQYKRWIQNAIYAYYLYQNGHHYTIEKDSDGLHKIMPVDYANTGVIQSGTTWGDGLHQFLQIKHGLKLTPETLITNYESNIAFIKRYGNKVVGITGTLGSDKAKSLLFYIYSVDFVKIPTHKPRQNRELASVVASADDDWIHSITHNAKREAASGRVVLVICETINYANMVLDQLKSNFIGNIKSYIHSDSHKNAFIDDTQLENTIIVATNLAGRGTDIKLTNTVIKNGGLHVLISFLPVNLRVEEQGFGRAARKGEPGTAQLILHAGHLAQRFIPVFGQQCADMSQTSIEIIRECRNEIEQMTLEQVRNDELKQIEIKDELFKEFRKLLKWLQDQDVGKNSILQKFSDVGMCNSRYFEGFHKRIVRQAVEERWGLWLKNCDTERDKATVLDDYFKFSGEIHEEYASGKVIKNPCYLIMEGNHYLVSANTWYRKLTSTSWTSALYENAEKCYTRAIAIDGTHSYLALFNRAAARIQLRGNAYKFHAKQDLLSFQEKYQTVFKPQMETVNAMYASLPDHALGDDKFRQLAEQQYRESNVFNLLYESSNQAIGEIERSEKLIDIAVGAVDDERWYTKKTDHEALAILGTEQVNQAVQIIFHDLKHCGDYIRASQMHNTLQYLDDEDKTAVIFSVNRMRNLSDPSFTMRQLLPKNRYLEDKLQKEAAQKKASDSESDEEQDELRQQIGLYENATYYFGKGISGIISAKNTVVSGYNAVRDPAQDAWRGTIENWPAWRTLSNGLADKIPVTLSYDGVALDYGAKLVSQVNCSEGKFKLQFNDLTSEQVTIIAASSNTYRMIVSYHERGGQSVDSPYTRHVTLTFSAFQKANQDDKRFNIKCVYQSYKDMAQFITLFTTDKAEDQVGLPAKTLINISLEGISQDKADDIIELGFTPSKVVFQKLNLKEMSTIVKYNFERIGDAKLHIKKLSRVKATNLISKADRDPDDVNIKMRSAEYDLLEEGLMNSDISFFMRNGLVFFYSVYETGRRPWLSIGMVAASSATQIAGGALLTVFTGGFGAALGSGLIYEGVGDLLRCVIGMSTGRLNVKEYAGDKAFSLMLTVAFAGATSAYASYKQSKAAKDAMKTLSATADDLARVSKEIKDAHLAEIVGELEDAIQLAKDFNESVNTAGKVVEQSGYQAQVELGKVVEKLNPRHLSKFSQAANNKEVLLKIKNYKEIHDAANTATQYYTLGRAQANLASPYQLIKSTPEVLGQHAKTMLPGMVVKRGINVATGKVFDYKMNSMSEEYSDEVQKYIRSLFSRSHYKRLFAKFFAADRLLDYQHNFQEMSRAAEQIILSMNVQFSRESYENITSRFDKKFRQQLEDKVTKLSYVKNYLQKELKINDEALLYLMRKLTKCGLVDEQDNVNEKILKKYLLAAKSKKQGSLPSDSGLKLGKFQSKSVLIIRLLEKIHFANSGDYFEDNNKIVIATSAKITDQIMQEVSEAGQLIKMGVDLSAGLLYDYAVAPRVTDYIEDMQLRMKGAEVSHESFEMDLIAKDSYDGVHTVKVVKTMKISKGPDEFDIVYTLDNGSRIHVEGMDIGFARDGDVGAQSFLEQINESNTGNRRIPLNFEEINYLKEPGRTVLVGMGGGDAQGFKIKTYVEGDQTHHSYDTHELEGSVLKTKVNPIGTDTEGWKTTHYYTNDGVLTMTEIDGSSTQYGGHMLRGQKIPTSFVPPDLRYQFVPDMFATSYQPDQELQLRTTARHEYDDQQESQWQVVSAKGQREVLVSEKGRVIPTGYQSGLKYNQANYIYRARTLYNLSVHRELFELDSELFMRVKQRLSFAVLDNNEDIISILSDRNPSESKPSTDQESVNQQLRDVFDNFQSAVFSMRSNAKLSTKNPGLMITVGMLQLTVVEQYRSILLRQVKMKALMLKAAHHRFLGDKIALYDDAIEQVKNLIWLLMVYISLDTKTLLGAEQSTGLDGDWNYHDKKATLRRIENSIKKVYVKCVQCRFPDQAYLMYVDFLQSLGVDMRSVATQLEILKRQLATFNEIVFAQNSSKIQFSLTKFSIDVLSSQTNRQAIDPFLDLSEYFAKHNLVSGMEAAPVQVNPVTFIVNSIFETAYQCEIQSNLARSKMLLLYSKLHSRVIQSMQDMDDQILNIETDKLYLAQTLAGQKLSFLEELLETEISLFKEFADKVITRDQFKQFARKLKNNIEACAKLSSKAQELVGQLVPDESEIVGKKFIKRFIKKHELSMLSLLDVIQQVQQDKLVSVEDYLKAVARQNRNNQTAFRANSSHENGVGKQGDAQGAQADTASQQQSFSSAMRWFGFHSRFKPGAHKKGAGNANKRRPAIQVQFAELARNCYIQYQEQGIATENGRLNLKMAMVLGHQAAINEYNRTKAMPLLPLLSPKLIMEIDVSDKLRWALMRKICGALEFSKLPVVENPDSQTKFLVVNVLGNGNCGLYSVGLTRIELVKIFIEELQKNNTDAITVLKNAISQLLADTFMAEQDIEESLQLANLTEERIFSWKLDQLVGTTDGAWLSVDRQLIFAFCREHNIVIPDTYASDDENKEYNDCLGNPNLLENFVLNHLSLKRGWLSDAVMNWLLKKYNRNLSIVKLVGDKVTKVANKQYQNDPQWSWMMINYNDNHFKYVAPYVLRENYARLEQFDLPESLAETKGPTI